MNSKKIVKIFLIFFLIAIIFVIYLFYKNKNHSEVKINPDILEDATYNSNFINDVNYITSDKDGNEYIVSSLVAEIDYADRNVLYLTDVKATIKLKNSDNIYITSKYGRYNSDNLDTIFSKNVLIKYLDNKIESNYLDFSMNNNKMIISKEVIYTNQENILRADVIEMNIKTKDTIIFMYEEKKKVNIQNIR